MCVGLHTVIESPRIGPGATGFGVVLALLLLSSHPVGALAQQRFHRLFTAEDGLNPPAVASLAQDSSGFLWIGTEGGGLHQLSDGALVSMGKNEGLAHDMISAVREMQRTADG